MKRHRWGRRWVSRGRVVALAFALATAAGCGRSDAEAIALQRVALSPVTDEALSRELESYMELELPDELGAAWVVEGANGELRAGEVEGGGEPRRRLYVPASGRTRRVRIRGDYDPARFNQLVLRMLCERDTAVNARFLKDGKPSVGLDGSVTVARSRTEKVVVLPMPKTRRKLERTEALELVFGAGGGAVVLWSIELIHRPLAAWLPAATDEPELVQVGDEFRRAHGLSTVSSLTGRFYAPRDGVLRLDCATPELARIAGAAPVLKLELKSGSRTWSHEVPMEDDLLAPASWHSLEVPLKRFEGREVDLRVELSGYGEREGLCALGPPAVVSRSARPPTVLLVTSDTHRADHVAAAPGAVDLRTPALDALVARGVFFEECFSTTNITNPSHVAIMTGVPMRDSGVVDNLHPLGAGARTLAEIFHDAGYATFGAVSAVHLAPGPSGLGQGFDRFTAPVDPKRVGEDTIATLRGWLQEAEGRPLFCWLHLFDAHAPYEPPEPYDRMYYEGNPFDGSLALSDAVMPEQIPPWLQGLRDVEFPPQQYRAEITYLDDQLGRVLELERMRDATVAVTSDHGELLGERSLYWQHGHLYPSVLHVPLVLAGPSIPRGKRVSASVQNHHLARTLLELVGVDGAELEGRNLLEALEEGYPGDAPRFSLSQRFTTASVSQDGWHLMLHLKGHVLGRNGALGKAEKHTVELYRYREDPACENNVAASERERAKAMRALLVAWLGEARDRGWSAGTNLDPELASKLQALGYTGETEDAGRGPLIDPDCACEQCAQWR